MSKIPVFYRPEQNCVQAASPSADKAQYVVESWLKKFGDQLEMHHYRPVITQELARAHSGEYVLDVLQGKTLNGFGNRDLAVVKTLPYTVGSFVAAARFAWETRDECGVACSPTSGFHHARYDGAAGFCTFNGLMVAAVTLLGSASSVQRVGIIDGDAHYGDGTDDIIQRLGLKKKVLHKTRRHHVSPPATNYFAALTTTLDGWKSMGVDIIFYQAGADAHINDPYGDGVYTSAELRERDSLIFKVCKDLKLPVVWNLAGGYQTDITAPEGDTAAQLRPVLNIHDATMEECVRVFGKES